MKAPYTFHLPRKYSLLEKIECGFATLLFLIGLIAVFFDEPKSHKTLFGIYYLNQILFVLLLYSSFLLLNLVVIPTIFKKNKLPRNLTILSVVVLSSVVVFPDPDDNLLLFTFLTYFSLKYIFLFLWRQFKIFSREKGTFLAGILVAVLFYLLLMFMFAGETHFGALVIPGILIPFCIGLYTFSFYRLLPNALQKKKPVQSYIVQIILVVLVSAIPLGFLTYFFTDDEDLPLIIATLNFPLQLFITAPFSWYVFKQHEKDKEEVYKLQSELGQSVAKFDFLRSQINPHFLFNALNTLYGTALQENAGRTGEGIQKLGEMMRFMLHENVQEKIPLEREKEYLENYISLQRLRTDPSPTVTIEATIQQELDQACISPMLLIPFVENAFKHGISLRKPSYIKISLEQKEKTLYFNVQNSKHFRQENDPELGRSGIGLENVKQRLELLYPLKHALSIKESSSEFLVYLKLELD